MIDLKTFTKTKDIDVAVNLHRLKVDADGDIYVSSRGDYYSIPSKLFLIDSKTDWSKKLLILLALIYVLPATNLM